MKVFNCPQLSEEWYELHRARPTASDFGKILSPIKAKPSGAQNKFINALIAQRFSNAAMAPGDSYASPAMMNGVILEPQARDWYRMEAEEEITEVGFCMTDDERFGASPDGLVGKRGGLEIACPNLETHIGYLQEGKIPTRKKCQIHGGLIVTGLDWWDFVSYAGVPGVPNIRIRVTPDDFTELLRAELDRFWERYQTALEKMRT